MAILRMDNVGIVFDDLDAAVAFFVELGLELEGQTTVEGQWVDRCVGLDGVRNDIATHAECRDAPTESRANPPSRRGVGFRRQ